MDTYPIDIGISLPALYQWEAHVDGGAANPFGVSEELPHAMGAVSEALLGNRGWGVVIQVVHLDGGKDYMPVKLIARADVRDNGVLRWLPGALVELRQRFLDWAIGPGADGRWRAVRRASSPSDERCAVFGDNLGELDRALSQHATS